jgi:hypothetical protein
MTRAIPATAKIFLYCFGLFYWDGSAVNAQTPLLASSATHRNSAQDSSPARLDLPTYSDPRFGISLQIPNNYTLLQGQGAGARPGDFNVVPEDYGEFLFAKLERSTPNPPFPVFSPSQAAIYFGVHLGISPEACLAPLDFPRYNSKGTVLISGITFQWSAELQTTNQGFRSPREPDGTYFRDYAGFANSVCYEFHLRTKTFPREDPLSTLEAVLSTVKIFPRTSAPPAEPGQMETPFSVPTEILALWKFAPWRVTYPKMGQSFLPTLQLQTGTLGERLQPPMSIQPHIGANSVPCNAIMFTFVNDLADGDAATVAIAKLEQDIVKHLQQHQWSTTSDLSPGIHNDSLRKNSAVVEFAKGTGRCTMNSPCTQFDSLTVTVYLPNKPL